MKHLHTMTRAPRQAQTQSLSAVFTLIANILFTVSTAVIAKENSEFPDISFPTPDES